MSEDFLTYVNTWDDLNAQIAKLKAKLKPLEDQEKKMRQALADSIKTALGEKLREGVNRYELPDGRAIKLTNKLDRKIEVAEIANAREAYSKQNDQPIPFDAILRTKFELDKREWDKLPDEAQKAISRMIITKPAMPTLEIE